MAPTGGAAKPPNRGRGRGEAGGRGRSPGVVGRGCVRILLQSWFQIIFNLSWLTMWVSDHLVKRNIIHTASQHMYGEGYSCNADERWNIFTDALVI